MAAAKAKFKKLLLNPGVSYDLDDERNNANDSVSQIVKPLTGVEGLSGAGVTDISKLRARNTRLLAETDERYQGKTVSRGELEDKEKEVEFYDPSLSKYFLDEEPSDEEVEKDVSEKCRKSIKKSKKKVAKNKIANSNVNNKLKKMLKTDVGKEKFENSIQIACDFSESDDYSDEEEDDNESKEEYETDNAKENEVKLTGFSYQDDGDYSKYGGASDDDSEDSSAGSESDSQHILEDDFNLGSSDENEVIIEQGKDKKQRLRGSRGKKAKFISKSDDSDAEDTVGETYENEESADDEDEEEDQDSEQDTDSGNASQGDTEGDGNINILNMKNLTEEQLKAKAVTNQLELYDRLFKARIDLQRIVLQSHQLPQPDVYTMFRIQDGERGTQYRELLEGAVGATTGLLQSLLQLQEAMLLSTPDTKFVLGEGKTSSATQASSPMDDDDEEITSSEDEAPDVSKGRRIDEDERVASSPPSENKVNRKRKRGHSTGLTELLEFEETLAKRHCSMRSYRNKVVAFWDERNKLLQTHRTSKAKGGGSSVGYAAFEESFSVMVQRLLADRTKLLQRTQLRSVQRGNYALPIGGKEEAEEVEQEMDPDLDIPKPLPRNLNERYDPEIYDDTDFYSRGLEELLSAKMRRGTSQLSAAQYYDMKQKLRKTTKKIVDTRRSKGRKLKYDVRSSLVQFMAPHDDGEIDDQAVDMLLKGLFRGSSRALSGAGAVAAY